MEVRRKVRDMGWRFVMLKKRVNERKVSDAGRRRKRRGGREVWEGEGLESK